MKAILIDAPNKRVIETVLPDDYSLNHIYDLIDCSIFECVRIDEVNSLFIDENGYFKKDTYNSFMYGNYGPIIGSALILGTNYETGESIEPTVELDDVVSQVNFLEPKDLKELYNLQLIPHIKFIEK